MPGQVDISTAQSAPAALRQLDELHRELASLQDQISTLRRRDETLNLYLHRVDEELRLAARLQRDFLPKELPKIGPVRFHTLYRPAGYVSGDLYDVMRLDEKHVGFYIADAVGHGVPAALLTMFIKQALVTKEITADGYRLLPPNESLARLNQTLVDQNLSHATFATALYGVIDVESLDVTVACAGHPAPMLIHSAGTQANLVEKLKPDGALLGVFPNERYEQATARLSPGDRLILYTDGIELAFGGETIDTDQWQAELRKRAHLAGDALLSNLCQHIDSETGSIAPKDDVTAIVLDVTSATPA